MASTRNAFSLLEGGAEQPFTAAKPKKKNKKKGSGGSGAAIAAPEAPIAAAPVVAAPAAPKAQMAKDARAALEAAAVAAVSGERAALAQDWTQQVLRSDAVYADGSDLVEFKEVLVKSRALELLLEGCMERGASAADATALAQLLAAVAHSSVPPHYTQALADAALRLGQLAAKDPLAPTPAAKRSAGAALGLVKRGIPKPPPAKPAETPAAKLKRLGGELGKQEARLTSTAQPKELCKLYSGIMELLCTQLDVLRPGAAEAAAAAAPVAPEVAAALKPLQELQAALSARLQEVQAPPKPVLSVADQVAEAERNFKKDDAATASRLTEVESRIASLEAELAALKTEATDLRQRRATARQHHQHRLDQIRSGAKPSAASNAEIAAAVQGGLGAVEGLAGSMRSGGSGQQGGSAPAVDASALGQQVVAAEVPVKLLGAMQQVVELNVQQLHDLGTKARFFRERLDKAVKQGEQAVKLGVGDPKVFAQQRATAEKNVKEVLAAAEAAAAAARGAVASYRERLPIMLRLPSFLPPPPEYLQAMEARAAEAEAVLQQIVASTYTPPAPAAAPAAAAVAGGVAPPVGAPAICPPGPPAAAPAATAAAAAAAPPADLSALELRLARLEAENQKKDAQIAAMISSSTLEVPSPLANRTSMPPAMLSSPTNNKPIGPAAPIAPAAPGPAAAAAPGPAPSVAAAPGAPAVITFSQIASAPPQANGQRKSRPRRA